MDGQQEPAVGLKAIEDAALSHYGLTEKDVASKPPLPQVSGNIPMSVNITHGSGSMQSEKETSAWATISGNIVINSPSNGTWTITVMDIYENKQVFNHSGMVAGTPYPYSYKTGWSVQLSVTAQWSLTDDTTLKGTVSYST